MAIAYETPRMNSKLQICTQQQIRNVFTYYPNGKVVYCELNGKKLNLNKKRLNFYTCEHTVCEFVHFSFKCGAQNCKLHETRITSYILHAHCVYCK